MRDFVINESLCRETVAIHPTWKNSWYGLNQTYRWGCCSYLYKKYGRPETYQAFYNNYTTDISCGQPQTYGRSEDYIYEVAKEFKNRCGEDYPVEDYYNYIVQKIIIDTLDGAKKESEAAINLEEKGGFTVIEPTYNEDKNYGIDLKCCEGETLSFLVQIKPHTFFTGNSNRGLIQDRKLALEKEKKCKELYGVPVYYYIYDKNTGEWIENNDGKYAHCLNQLLWDNGFTKFKLYGKNS